MLSDTLNKISRLMFILNALDRGKVQLSRLAADLSVNVRTLQRDIRVLEEAGFPIANPSKGVYCLVEGYSLQKMQLSAKEAALLAILSNIVASLGGSFQETYVTLRNRVLEMAPENPFFIKIPKGQAFLNDEQNKLIERAIKKREKLEIVYEKSKLSGKNISPLKIAWFDGFWYLLALGKDDLILKLRLDKIKRLTPTGLTFRRPEKIEKILEESVSVWFEGTRHIRVELKISAQAAPYFEKKDYFPKQKKLGKTDAGEMLVECLVGKYEEIIPTVLAWMPHIIVCQPAELAACIAEKVAVYHQKIK